MKQVTIADPDRDLTRDERRIYERQEYARKVFILKQVAFIEGRIPDAPEWVPCPIDPRK